MGRLDYSNCYFAGQSIAILFLINKVEVEVEVEVDTLCWEIRYPRV